MSSYLVLKWAHIVAMAYWLGGEWGVFNASRPITNSALTLDERRRHMETSYRIDILPRTGIILLLPLGLHLGNILGVQPLGGPWIVGMWIAVAAWLSITWTAYAQRGTDLGIRLTKIDEAIRYFVIPALLIVSLLTFFTGGPLGANWYAAKMFVYALLLVIGLLLRYIMRDWVMLFRQLSEGPNEAVETKLSSALARGRQLAYIYWIGIALVAYFGVAKPAFQ